ncbi:MAG: hypothetical protein ABJC88_16870 [Parasphingorhabdus sp.]|uniref:hypothetical protein n=1 Tax=Sphingomonadales TaxID=204457 RepID=UPI003265148A
MSKEIRTTKRVRLAIMKTQHGFCIVATEQNGTGVWQRLAGQMDGSGGYEVQAFTVDVSRIESAINTCSFDEIETIITD